MDNEEKCVRHLEMIQGVINRLASSSFAVKGWSVALVSTLVAIAVNKGDGRFAFAALLPAVIFWMLDGYFLWQERLFRSLFDAVRLEHSSRPEEFFTMDTRPYLKSTSSWFQTSFVIGKKANTLLRFHGTIVLVVLIAVKILG